MKERLICLVLVLTLSLTLIGCGGGGGGNESPSTSPSSGVLNIVGSWSGNVAITSATPDETYAATIKIINQSSGTFSGTINVGLTGNMPFSGTISSDGSSLTFTYTRSDGLVVNGSGSATTTTMSGTFNNTAGESGTFSFTKSGSSSSPSPSPSSGVNYSSDYCGIEVGFQLTYSASETYNGSTETGTYISNVMSVASKGSGIYVYKMATAYTGETLGTYGEYLEKSGVNYYYYGDWEGTTNDIETTPSLMVRNPITTSFNSPAWGTNKGQVTVKVPAGTFTAWLFEDSYTTDLTIDSDHIGSCTITEKLWFVPYIGLVKATETDVRRSDSRIVYTSSWQLSTIAKGVTITNSMIKASNAGNQFIAKRLKGWFR